MGRAWCGFGGDWQGSPIDHPFSLPSPSSDAELNCSSSEASSMEPCEERPQQPDPLPLLEPLSRHRSLREPLSRAASAQGPKEPRALHGERKACLPRNRLAGSRVRGKEQRVPWPVFPAEDPVTGAVCDPQAQRQRGWNFRGAGVHVRVTQAHLLHHGNLR